MEQIDHRFSHGDSDVHVGFGISVVVVSGASASRLGVGVTRGGVAFEFRILASPVIDRQHGLENLSALARLALSGLNQLAQMNLALGEVKSFRSCLIRWTRFFS